MTYHVVEYDQYLVKDRADNLTLVDFVICHLCDGILWQPKACKDCEHAYCALCIKIWKTETAGSTRCPNNCSKFIECPCPQVISRILSKLQITCRFKSNGCTETLPYNNLETHEEVCGYRLISCSGCDEKIIKKDFKEHDNTCPLVSLTCYECHSVYKRQDENAHTDIKCLRVQLHQMKEREQEHSEQLDLLRSQVNYLQDIIKQIST